MEQAELDFSNLKERLKFFTRLNPDDLREVVFFFERVISSGDLNLTSDQKECLLYLVRYSGNAHRYWELDTHVKETKLKAEYILLNKGKAESKYPQVLKLYGLDQTTLKKQRASYMKNLYEMLYRRASDTETESGGVHEIVYQISRKRIPIRWRTDLEKKNSLLDFIKTEFYEDSVTRNAVVMALRRAKTKYLPGVSPQ